LRDGGFHKTVYLFKEERELEVFIRIKQNIFL